VRTIVVLFRLALKNTSSALVHQGIYFQRQYFDRLAGKVPQKCTIILQYSTKRGVVGIGSGIGQGDLFG